MSGTLTTLASQALAAHAELEDLNRYAHALTDPPEVLVTARDEAQSRLDSAIAALGRAVLDRLADGQPVSLKPPKPTPRPKPSRQVQPSDPDKLGEAVIALAPTGSLGAAWIAQRTAPTPRPTRKVRVGDIGRGATAARPRTSKKRKKTPTSPPVRVDPAALAATAGKLAVIVGGDARGKSRERLQDAFGFKKLVWEKGWNMRRAQALRKRIERGSVDCVIFLQRYLNHKLTKLLVPPLREARVLTVWVEQGYGVRAVEAGVLRAIGGEADS